MAQITEVLAKLLERTSQGKVSWRPTAAEQTFVAVIGNVSLMIQKNRGSYPVLRIFTRDGREVEELDGETPEGFSSKDQLKELHQKARHIALEADSLIDELLKVLEADA